MNHLFKFQANHVPKQHDIIMANNRQHQLRTAETSPLSAFIIDYLQQDSNLIVY